MTQSEFSHLMDSIKALSPEQMRQLRQELDGELAAAEAEPEVAPPSEPAPRGGKRIWEVAEDIRRSVPAEEWAKLPADGAEQHDHYIYGTPKRPPSP
jgi:hypothetical protein